jgi:predicted nucleic acid-binding protein
VSLIFWDTMIFVYWIEQHPDFTSRVDEIRRRMWERKDQLCTSTITLGQVLSGPYAKGDLDLSRRYKELIARPLVQTIPFTEETAEHFARIRADRSIAPADAMQLACAAQARVDLFLTNDRRLARKAIPGIQFIADLSFDYL